MPWKKLDLKKWANAAGIDLNEIDQKLKLREMIVQLRKASEMSQADLADRVGVSRSRVAQIESGVKLHRMSFDILFRVLQGLGYRCQITTRKIAA